MKALLKWAGVAFGAMIVIVIIGAIAGGSSPEDDTQTTQPPKAESADTGRMSGTEWETASTAVDRMNGELRDFGDAMAGKCATIAQAGQMAEYFKCADDAYEGVEGRAGMTAVTLEDLVKATARTCRKNTRRAHNRVNRGLFQALQAVKRGIDTGNFAVVAELAKGLSSQRRLWGDATGDMLETCAP